MGSQRFCLRWNNHQSNLLSVFDQLLHDEAFVDVTLAVEGQLLKAHKMVLSACSPYFQALFVGHPDKHPIVILKDVPYSDMRSLLDFMYRGEVSVDQDRLTAFLKVAESLRIKGLTEVNEERCDLPSIANSLLMNQNTPPPQSPAQQHHIQQQLLTSNQQQQQLVPVSQQQQPSPQQSQLVGGGKSPQQHPPPPPNLHRIHLPVSNSGKRHHLSSSGHNNNPMLNSALTAPKRKRGRPRKLSGSSPGGPVHHSSHPTNNPPAAGHSQTTSDQLEETKHNNIEHQSGGGVVSSNGGGEQSPPHGGKVADDCKREPPETAGNDAPQPPSSPHDPSVDDSTSEIVKMEPTPGTSMQDSAHSFQSSNTQDGERFQTSGKEREIKCETEEDSQHSDLAECYDDMIACSPASSYEGEGVEEEEGGGGVTYIQQGSLEPEYLDIDISQYELDSFRTLMGQQSQEETPHQQQQRREVMTTVIAPSFDGRRRIDKMSIRKYCSREANHVYRCIVCSKTYTHISNFCRHFLSAHCGAKQDVHCPVCFKPFTRKDNMMTHAKQVHGVSVKNSGSGGVVGTPAGVSATTTATNSGDTRSSPEPEGSGPVVS